MPAPAGLKEGEMRKHLIVVGMIAAFTMLTGTAMADSIKGRFGVTGRLGFVVPSDGKLGTVVTEFGTATPTDDKVKNSTSFAGGGGFIYGITDNLAVEMDVTHAASFKAENVGVHLADISTTNVLLGLQYRFIPESKFVPYLGTGLDILVNDSDDKPFTSGGANVTSKSKIDTVVGGHISAGADYFLTKQIALNADFRGVFAPEADVKTTGTITAGGISIPFSQTSKYDPISFTGLFGVRFFFN